MNVRDLSYLLIWYGDGHEHAIGRPYDGNGSRWGTCVRKGAKSNT